VRHIGVFAFYEVWTVMTPTPHLRYFVGAPQPGIPVNFKLKQWWIGPDGKGEWRGIDQRADDNPTQKDPP
jgi:hypothetical protein